MDNMNNNFNNPNGTEEVKIQGVSIGAMIGLFVLIGVIIGTVMVFSKMYKEFNEFTDMVENIPENIVQTNPGDITPDSPMEDILDDVEPSDGNEDEEITIDPYAKHKNVEFAGTKDTVKNITLYIENGKVYSKDSSNGKKTLWKTVGTPKKILFNPPAVSAIVVTEEGKAYDVSYDVCEELKELSKYTIIDIARINNHTFETIYYLTSDGKLIDINGVSYDKYSFVNTVGYGKMWQIPVDKNNYGYHYNYDKDEYVVITNKAKAKVSFSKIYTFEEFILIQSSKGKLFKYDGESNIANEESSSFVSRIERKVDGDNTNIVVTFMDLSTKEYKEVTSAYDVKADKEIDINKLTKYVEQPKVEVPNISDTIEELEKISDLLRRQIIAAYDGKTLTGIEVIVAFQQYENSDMSIMAVTKEKGTAYTGKYRLNKNNLKVENSLSSETVKEHKAYEGGVYYVGAAAEFDTNVKRNSLTEIQSTNGFGINATKVFYSSIIKDVDGDAFGILFLER
ncbi:MAG: hypothetical protein IKL68_00260 [Clostridia bacterium]|nr:hypothetical protein [Clostridia bacterium]